jgi:hypothetical protein
VNLRRLRIGEWLMAVAGAALLATLFLDWYSPALSAWEAFTVIDLLLALLAVAALGTVPLVAGARTAAPGVAYEALVLLGGIVGVLICVLRLVDVPADGLSLASGAWIGLIVSLGLCAACLVAMRDERRSTPDRQTDSTGVPVDAQPEPEHVELPPA